MTVMLHGLATVLPPHDLPQDLVQARAEKILGPRYPQFARLLTTFSQSGIERRRSVAPLEWFDDAAHGWEERNRIWHNGCAAMVRDASAMLDLGEVSTADVDVWRGLRPCMPDGMPAIGRARGTRNVWLATGHQMTGLKTAPATGRLLAELICGETPSTDPTPFRADRF